MKKRLREILSKSMSSDDLINVSSSYDIVGSIAILRLPSASQNVQIVAKAVMDVHRNVKSVFVQRSPVAGDFRLRCLTHVAGENRTSTIHRESGCFFAVDVEKCYFSPRLTHERSRVASLVQPNETIVNMFAGVGCFSIIIAKHVGSAKVFSVDISPVAIQFMNENVRLNRVYSRVVPILGDAKKIVECRLRQAADRVLMPLPAKALEYLPSAVKSLKPSGGWIHYYDFEHASKTEDPVEKTRAKVTRELMRLGVSCEVPFSRVVRTVGPNWHQVVLDVYFSGVPDKS